MKKQNKVKRTIFEMVVTIFMTGMITSCAPNIVHIQKGGILAGGGTSNPPFRGGEKIGYLDIDPQKMSYQDKTNLWVEILEGEKTSFASMTRSRIKSLAVWEEKDPRSDSDEKAIYYHGGFLFKFDGELLVNVKIVDQGWQTHYAKAFPKIGSFSSGYFLVLPCTLKQFEDVFGKPDSIDRKWVN